LKENFSSFITKLEEETLVIDTFAGKDFWKNVGVKFYFGKLVPF